MADLFSDAADARLPERAPLAARLRPARLKEFVGQEQAVGPGSALALAIAEDRVGSAVFYGPPGSGRWCFPPPRFLPLCFLLVRPTLPPRPSSRP